MLNTCMIITYINTHTHRPWRCCGIRWWPWGSHRVKGWTPREWATVEVSTAGIPSSQMMIPIFTPRRMMNSTPVSGSIRNTWMVVDEGEEQEVSRVSDKDKDEWDKKYKFTRLRNVYTCTTTNDNHCSFCSSFYTSFFQGKILANLFLPIHQPILIPPKDDAQWWFLPKNNDD